MDLFARFWRVCRAQLSHWLDGVEDPSKNLDLTLHEAEDRYRGARDKVVLALATKKKLERSIRTASEQAARKKEEARSAVRAGNAAAARRALDQCQRLLRAADVDAQSLLRVTEEVKGLQAGLTRLEERLDSASRRRGELVGDLAVGEAKMSLAGATEQLMELETRRVGSAERELADLAERLNCEGEARLEMASGGNELDSLASELARLDAGPLRLPASEGGK